MRGLWIFDHADIAGGGQRFALRLARYAAERGEGSVRMVCPADSVLADWCREAGIAVVDADSPAFHAVPRALAALARSRRLLAEVPADELIVANSARVQAYLFGASRLVGRHAPVVNLMHEQDSARRPSARFAYRRFGSLLVIGDVAASAYRERLPGVEVTAANNFLLHDDLARFTALRSRRPAAERPLVLACLGRMIPEKGLLEFVEELADSSLRPLWRQLLLAAFPQDEEYERRLRARIGELGLKNVVRLEGPRPADELLVEADVLVVPSTGNEAQPTVIIEALVAGVPVIVRSPVWSTDYEDLPVLAYGSMAELQTALGRLPLLPADATTVARRFSPDRFMAALQAAARRTTTSASFR